MWITCVYMAFGGVSEGIIYGEEYRGERNADVNGNTSRHTVLSQLNFVLLALGDGKMGDPGNKIVSAPDLNGRLKVDGLSHYYMVLSHKDWELPNSRI